MSWALAQNILAVGGILAIVFLIVRINEGGQSR